jgi:hypothetical protein
MGSVFSESDIFSFAEVIDNLIGVSVRHERCVAFIVPLFSLWPFLRYFFNDASGEKLYDGHELKEDLNEANSKIWNFHELT